MTDRTGRSTRIDEQGFDSKYVPWRGSWMGGSGEGSTDGCVLCALPREGGDRDALVLARSDESYVVLNVEPYNVGHVMVVPFAHEDAHDDLPVEAAVDLALTLRTTMGALREAFDPDGFNTGTNVGGGSGGSVGGHLHVHVIPRWEGDTDFLPLTGGTTLVEGSLLDMYDEAHAALADATAAAGTTDAGAVRLDHSFLP